MSTINLTKLDDLIARLHLADASDLDLPCAMFYRGHTFMSDGPEDVSPGAGWTYREEWSNGYRAVWSNDAENAIFTYCEGDLDLTVDSTPEDFRRRLASANDFYTKVGTR